MEQINLSDVNFYSLQKLKQQGTKASLYKDGNVCYKILDGCSYNGHIAPFISVLMKKILLIIEMKNYYYQLI